MVTRRHFRYSVLISAFALVFVAGASLAEPQALDARSTASDLAARLSSAPNTSAWVSDATKQAAFQADVNRLAYLSSLLAGELASGKGREETAGIYRDLRSVGLRILTRSRASGIELPKADVAAYEQLMSKLEAYYGPVR